MSQVSSLIAELASAAAAEKGIAFDEGVEERLCAYSRAVSHFPTAVKEVILHVLPNCKNRKPAKPQFLSQEKPRLIQNQIGSLSRGDKENTGLVGIFVETDDSAGI